MDVGCKWRIYIASMPSEGEESILLPHEGENKNKSDLATKIPSFLAYSLRKSNQGREGTTQTLKHTDKSTHEHTDKGT